jgi:GT2 family glycosyltransferase
MQSVTPDHAPCAASVVIPSFNKRETLAEVLGALRQQTVPAESYEVVVVDDGSTDGTRELVQALAGSAPRVVLEEMGPHTEICPGRVRNRGLARARGEAVIFLDADILVGPDFVRQHLEALQQGPPDGTAVIGYIHAYPLLERERLPEAIQAPPLAGLRQQLPELLRAPPKRWKDGREENYRVWPELRGCPLPWLFFWSGNISLGRRLAQEVGGFDESFKRWGFEDVELGYRLWKRGATFVLARPAWGFHYPHPTATDDARRFANMRQFLGKHPEPYVELSCFSMTRFQQPGASRVRWEVIDLLGAPPAARTPSLADGLAVLGLARQLRGGAVAWFGELPADLPSSCRPELAARPFLPPDRPGQAALIGLATPHDDDSFGTAVLAGHWQDLSDAAVRFACAELLRIAPTCLVVSLSGDRSIPAGLAARTTELAGVRVHVLERGPPS